MSMLDNTAFDTAIKNMSYDEQLISKLHQGEIDSFFRFYNWNNISVTQSINRAIESEFVGVDHSYRITGGGLVFHCPGDIVFSIGNRIKHNVLPQKLKERCQWLAKFLTSCLTNLNVPVNVIGDVKGKNQNINFCSSYHNPYEVALGSDKVIGLALKKTKYWIVFQGVIHMSKTADYFKDFTNYDQYFTNGILSKAKVESELLYHEILSQLTHLKLI
jgi:lipoate-protein ligase A